MTICIFFVPGILLLFSKAFCKKSLTELLIYIVAASLSFFIVFSWFIKSFDLPLLFCSYLVIICSLMFLLIGYKKIQLKNINIDQNEMRLMWIFIFVLILRLLPVFFQLAPAGGDMSMHSYLARIICDNNGIPASYKPLFPISNFGAYPIGFPILSALSSLFGSFTVYRTSLFMLCLTHALIGLALYVFLLRFFDRNTAAAASIAATFLTRSPQWIIRWGGNPTVLAFFFFIIAFSLIIEQKENFSWIKGSLASLALAATLFTHPIIFFTGAMIIAVYLIITFREFKHLIPSVLCLSICLFIFAFPFLKILEAPTTASAIEYSKSWQIIDFKSVIYDFIAGIPFLILSLLGLTILAKENKRVAYTFLLITGALLLLIANFRFWLVPFSYLLYPGRVALFLIIPLSVFASPAMARVIAMPKKHLAIILSIVGMIFYSVFYLYNSVAMCSVMQPDLYAFKWMDNKISKKAVIINNYGDAGLWIPAIIGRTITNPHSPLVFLNKSQSELLNKLKAEYLYIGSKAVYPIEFKEADLKKSPGKYKLIYSKDGAQIWKIL